jgi:hypothetical protein
MEEKKVRTKESIEYILENILRLLSQDGHASVCGTNVSRQTREIYASDEEGARFIHAFIRIKQPELRAALINLATEMADVKASTDDPVRR